MSSSAVAMLSALVLLGTALAVAERGSSSPEDLRAAWVVDWNGRVDANQVLKQHPCGDYAFDPWAFEFLAECEDETVGVLSAEECEARTSWVWERSRQCNVWQGWLLRNHNRQARNQADEPETRVE